MKPIKHLGYPSISAKGRVLDAQQPQAWIFGPRRSDGKMASAIALKASLRRSKSSLQSLSSYTSPEPRTSGIRRDSRPSKESPSSLYLHDISFSSLPPFETLLERQASSISSGTFSDEGSTNTTNIESIVLDAGSNLIQLALLLALVFHVPNLLEEIHLILDLHYHSFPMLVVLGSFPLLLKRSLKKLEPTEDEKSYSEFNHVSSRSAEMYRSESSLTLDSKKDTFPEIASDSISYDTDDWGHFAELDETMMSIERNLSLKVSSRHTMLSTLEEVEEEE